MKQVKPIIHGRDHLPGGADPLIQYPTGDTMDSRILAAGPAGFWKLNESSGHVAADSSGFGQDLSTAGGELDPLWGFPAGPPGEQAADFQHGTGATASRVSRSWPALTADFTAAIWVNRHDLTSMLVMGQGNPERSGGRGWEIGLWGSSMGGAQTNRPYAKLYDGVGGYIAAMNPLAVDTWAFLALVYTGADTSYKLYVNGLLEGTADPVSWFPVTGPSPLWIGHDGGLGSFTVIDAHFAGSYAFLVNRAMSGAELSGIVTGDPAGTPTVTDPTGYVPTVTDDGSIVLQPPGVEVEHGGGPPDDTPVATPPAGSGDPTSSSGWHLSVHVETVVLYDSTPGRFDVPTMKWVRVPFNTVRIWRTWEATVGATATKTAWLPDDRQLTEQAKQGILHVGAGMAFDTPQSVSAWFSPEWPMTDPSLLPNEPATGLDAYVRAGRIVNASTGSVLRASPGSSSRRFFEWQFPDTADGIPDWVDYPGTDNPYPIYPVWAPRPLTLPPPYPKLTDAMSGVFYAPQKTFGMDANLTVGDNLCLQVWQDSPWLLRFSTDAYRIPYPSLQPGYLKRPYLFVSYAYDPETINHTTGKLL